MNGTEKFESIAPREETAGEHVIRPEVAEAILESSPEFKTLLGQRDDVSERDFKVVEAFRMLGVFKHGDRPMDSYIKWVRNFQNRNQKEYVPQINSKQEALDYLKEEFNLDIEAPELHQAA